MRETHAIIVIAIVAILIGLGAFIFSDAAAPSSGSSARGSVVIFHELAKGENSTVKDRVNYVIRSEAELDQLWRLIDSTDDVPSVNFSTHNVIAVFAGEQPTAGYEIDIETVVDGVSRKVLVELVKPGASCLLAQMITQPYQIVVLPKTDLPLTHENKESITSCLQ